MQSLAKVYSFSGYIFYCLRLLWVEREDLVQRETGYCAASILLEGLKSSQLKARYLRDMRL